MVAHLWCRVVRTSEATVRRQHRVDQASSSPQPRQYTSCHHHHHHHHPGHSVFMSGTEIMRSRSYLNVHIGLESKQDGIWMSVMQPTCITYNL